MSEITNKIGLSDLIEKTKLTDDDIIVIEDSENTKRVSFRNLRDSLIDDNELPSEHRMYSSHKLDQTFENFQKQLDHNIGKIQNTIDGISENYITESQVDKKIEDFSNTVSDLADVESIKQALASKRDVTIAITCKDLATDSDANKIQLKNLSSEVLESMAGSTPLVVPSVPTGGWVQEDIAAGAITATKLAKQYRYKGYYPEGDINQFTSDGLYILGYSVKGLPFYKENETEDRLLEVTNIGEDQYITQKVYYLTDMDEDVRPTYVRKSTLSFLHVTKFTAEYHINDNFKITRNVLKDNVLYNGVVSSGNVFDLTMDGNYYIEKGVTNLPDKVHNFTVSVQNFGTRVEYTAKLVDHEICETYIANTYLTSSNLKKYTPWYQTNTVKKSRLQNKTLHLFGDGICFGMGSTNIPTMSYPALLTSRYGISINNHALGDATVGVYGDEYLAERSVIKQIEEATINDGDLVIIFAGSNDYKSGVAKIGSNIDINNYSFKGALNTCISNLLTKCAGAKLLVISPLFRARLDADDFRNGDDTPINELYLKDYANAMKEVCEYNHIPFLDLYSTSMINKYNFTKYLKDRFYPNDFGHDMIADKIFAALNNFY